MLARAALCLAVSLASLARATETRIASPDGKVTVEFALQDRDGGSPTYRVSHHGKPVVEESRLGFLPDLSSGFQVAGSEVRSHRGRWENAFGEKRDVPDEYSELSVDLKHASGKRLRVVFRAYNEGAAFRYAFPAQEGKGFRFAGERTEFRFPTGTFAYEEHATEGEYHRVKVEEVKPWCERPLTVEYADGRFAVLAEADNERFPRMLLSGEKGVPGTLVSVLGGESANGLHGQRNDPSITISPGESSPWRTFIVGDKPGDLLERNYLMLNLNPQSAIKDTSWIRPGRAMRDGAMTTTAAKAIVDLAPKLGLDYVGFDAHWYGPDDTSDASQIRKAGLNIKEAAAYARERGIGTCVYIDGRQAKKQAATLFPMFKNDWGVDAVKVGFVAVGPQEETSWITDLIALAAKNQLVLDIHDGYRATGNNRTYPNLLTVEGIRGNENHPTPEHNCTLPFTRFVGGQGDYTICYFDKRNKTTHAHQMAMSVVVFSPLQWLYWYDKPEQFDPVPPECEFFTHLPTVWDETRVIHGEIGEFASIARRKGDAWFVGTITNSAARELDLPLSFLSAGKAYIAHSYSDDPASGTATQVRVGTETVTNATTLHVKLQASGGQALWIEPAK